jgi:hypothetical protein
MEYINVIRLARARGAYAIPNNAFQVDNPAALGLFQEDAQRAQTFPPALCKRRVVGVTLQLFQAAAIFKRANDQQMVVRRTRRRRFSRLSAV